MGLISNFLDANNEKIDRCEQLFSVFYSRQKLSDLNGINLPDNFYMFSIQDKIDVRN